MCASSHGEENSRAARRPPPPPIQAGLGRPARMLLSTTTLLGPHLPECQDKQGQEQEAPQRAANDDPDGDLRVFLLGDLKRDL